MLLFPDVFLTFMHKKLYSYQYLDSFPINLSKIENKSVKFEQLLLLIYNFTYVVSISTS